MTAANTVYDQIADFIAGMNPQKVVDFKASPEHQLRLDELLDKQIEQGLTNSEKNELEHYLIINRIIGLAKARAFHTITQ